MVLNLRGESMHQWHIQLLTRMATFSGVLQSDHKGELDATESYIVIHAIICSNQRCMYDNDIHNYRAVSEWDDPSDDSPGFATRK